MGKRLQELQIRLLVTILGLPFREPDYKKIYLFFFLKVFMYKAHAVLHRYQQLFFIDIKHTGSKQLAILAHIGQVHSTFVRKKRNHWILVFYHVSKIPKN